MTAPKRAPDILAAAAATFAQRNPLYGNNYLRFGEVMKALFPPDSPPALDTVEDWNRLGILVQCVSKLTRYAGRFDAGGHLDSAHDLCVYAAMLEEVTDEPPPPPAADRLVKPPPGVASNTYVRFGDQS